MRPLAIAVTVFSSLLWGASIWGVFSGAMPGDGGAVLRDAAATSAVIAAVLWVARGTRKHAGSLGLLVRTVADATQPDDGHHELRLVREAGAEAPRAGSAPRRL